MHSERPVPDMDRPAVIVAFCPPDKNDWLSRLCGWFCRRADGSPYSHATLIVGKKAYEWRVGGLSSEDQLQWLMDSGSSRPPTYLYVKLTDSQLLRLLYILEALSYTPGARYRDFINFALERSGWLLCTG